MVMSGRALIGNRGACGREVHVCVYTSTVSAGVSEMGAILLLYAAGYCRVQSGCRARHLPRMWDVYSISLVN